MTISLQEAFSFVTPSSDPEIAPAELSRDEERTLVKFMGAIDAIIVHEFTGMPMNVQIREEAVPEKIAREVLRRYRAGGWRVATRDGRTFSFAPGRLATKSIKAVKTGLPAIATQPSTAVAPAGKRLLVRMPTRSRPVQALSVLAKYRAMAGCPIQIEVVVDEDDESMLAAEVIQRLCALGCIITVGAHKSKIEACNGGCVSEWDVLLLASDDMVPIVDGYAIKVLAAMERHWPHLDGAVYFDDGYQGEDICTLPIVGRRFYDQFGCIYHSDYKSLMCDREQTELWTAMGRLTYVDEKIIEHWHPAWGFGRKDELYKRNDALEDEDKATYARRRTLVREGAQFAFDSPPLWLSVLICSLPSRRPSLERLLDYLWTQTNNFVADDGRTVEILVDDREGITIGEKRQALLERARGHFIAHIDDDDFIAHDYVDRVVGALCANPTADCASLVGVMTTSGEFSQRFEHSVVHAEWGEKDGVLVRNPNHLNAVRRDLALQVGFVSGNHGEDHDFSMRLKPLLKSEASTGDAPLYFYFYEPAKKVP